MLRECRVCGADFYKESYSANCPTCNRQMAAEKRAENAAQRATEAQYGYDWGYAFWESVGNSGCRYSFILDEDGGLSFTVDYVDYFTLGQANQQFVQGMKDRLNALGWNKGSRAERIRHIKSSAYSAGRSPACHQYFEVSLKEVGLNWSLSRYPRVKFINQDYKKRFVDHDNCVLEIDGILVYRVPVFRSRELQQEFDRGLRDYVSANLGRAKQKVFENTKNTKVEIGILKRSLLATYMILATIGIPGKFANGFGWFGLPVYFIATYLIWNNKERAWNTIWRGPARFTLGLHVILIFSLIKLNSFYAYLGRLLDNLF